MYLSLPRRTSTFALLALLLLPGSPADSVLHGAEDNVDPAATREYAVAVGLQSKQLYPAAARRWQHFLDTYPGDPRRAHAYHHLGTCQLHSGQAAEAASTFRKLLDTLPQAPARDAASYNLGLALYQVGLASKKADELRTAAQAFADVAARFPGSKHAAAALYYQGECLYQANDLPGAAACYRKVLANHPGSDLAPETLYALGTVLQEQGQEREEAVTYQQLLERYPKHRLVGETQLRLGMALVKQGRSGDAMRHFELAAAWPDFPLADYALMQQAQCAYEQKQPVQAAGLYEQVAKKHPSSSRAGAALLAAGKCWYQAGRWPEAEAALAGAVGRKGKEAGEAAYWQGQVLLKLQRPADAVRVLDRAITGYPQSSFLPQMVFCRLEALYAQPAERPKTAALFAEFARKHAGHELAPRALYMAALAALGAGDYPAALQNAEALLAQFPKHELAADALFLAGEACLGGRDIKPKRAEELFRRLLAEHPQHRQAAVARVRVGLCLYLAHRYAEAVSTLTQTANEVQDSALRAEALFLMGRSHLDAGQPAEAVAALRRALETRPSWERGDEVLLALAEVLHKQHRPEEARAALERLPRDYPQSALQGNALYQLGELAQEQKKLDEAAGHYEQVVARYPGSAAASQAQLALGTVWLARRDPARAIRAFDTLLEKDPHGPLAAQAHHRRGLAHQQQGELEPAAADLAAFLSAKPPGQEAADARFALAVCQSGLKRHAEAAATLGELLRERPDFPRADRVYYEMGHALLLARKDREAGAAFEQLVTRSPDSPLAAESWFRVGEIREGAGDPAGAARAYGTGLDRARDQGLREKMQYRLGWVEMQRQELTRAVETLRAQLKESPNGELAPDATYLAGDCLYRLNHLEEARPFFEKLIEGKSAKYQDRALYRCGACLAGLHDWKGSQKCYEQLIRQAPGFKLIEEARYGLAWALQNQDRLAEAREIYEQITRATRTETAAKSRFMIGECAFRQKKYEEAIEHFLEAALAYPYEEWQALGHFEAGRCFILLKDPARAREELQTVVEKHPKHPRAKDAARMIAELKQEGR